MSRPVYQILAAGAATLVTHADVARGLDDYLHVVASALDASTVSVLVRGRFAEPELFGATSQRTEEMELHALSHNEGPSLDALATGQVVTEAGEGITQRWPTVGAAVRAAGLDGITAIPLLWHQNVVGGPCTRRYRARAGDHRPGPAVCGVRSGPTARVSRP